MTRKERWKRICKACDQSKVCGYYLNSERRMCDDLWNTMLGWTLGQLDTLDEVEDYVDQGNTEWTKEFMDGLKQRINETNRE